MPRGEIVNRFERYQSEHHLPVEYGVTVHMVEAADDGYRVRTNRGDLLAKNVIIATGLFQKPKIPPYAAGLNPDILQLHSGQYRNPQMLPDGAVLVVGSAQSGCQIAEELYRSGRKVYLSVCSAGRAPRRYRGRDVYDWLHRSGFLDRTADKLPSPQARFAGNPQLTGKDGGRALNLHIFYRDGVTLLGRLQDIREDQFIFAPDLKENLGKADVVEDNILKWIDSYIERERIDAPHEEVPLRADAYAAPEILALDPHQAGIRSVVWASGYTYDFSMVKLPVFDQAGFPTTQRGATRFPGLYFLGMPWLYTQKGGLLLGVGEDAAYLVDHLVDNTSQPRIH
jgi:putative flavoprotein involved in K+ transport